MLNPMSDLEGIVIPLIYPSELPTPWPYYTHFNVKRVEKTCLDYIRKTYGISGAKEDEFCTSTNPTFICTAFPDGSEEQVQFMSDHVAWFTLLDDIVDQAAQIGTQYEKVAAIFADIELTLDISLIDDPNNFTTIWGKEHAKLYRRFLDFGMTDEDLRLWNKGLLGYTQATLAQIKNRGKGWDNIPVWKYTLIRRGDSGNTWYIPYIQWCNNVCLPRETWDSYGFQRLMALTSDWINHANDAASYAKEYCCGDYSNIITTVMKNYHELSTQDALYVIAQLSKLVLEEFDRTVDAFMFTLKSKKLRNDVDHVILGLRKYVSGYAPWNAETNRYKLFGDEKGIHDVHLKRIDVTNVPIEERLCKIAKEIFEDTYNRGYSVDMEKLK